MMFILKYVAVAANEVKIPPVEASSAAAETFLRMVFLTVGAIALFYITYAGFKYTVSGGEPGAISKAKNQIIYGVIGLIVAISAYSIVGFVLQRV